MAQHQSLDLALYLTPSSTHPLSPRARLASLRRPPPSQFLVSPMTHTPLVQIAQGAMEKKKERSLTSILGKEPPIGKKKKGRSKTSSSMDAGIEPSVRSKANPSIVLVDPHVTAKQQARARPPPPPPQRLPDNKGIGARAAAAVASGWTGSTNTSVTPTSPAEAESWVSTKQWPALLSSGYKCLI